MFDVVSSKFGCSLVLVCLVASRLALRLDRHRSHIQSCTLQYDTGILSSDTGPAGKPGVFKLAIVYKPSDFLAGSCITPFSLFKVNQKIGLVRFEVLTAVTMKNAVFWDIKPQFILHMRHITFPLQSPAG
jgi:hypothetical protein